MRSIALAAMMSGTLTLAAASTSFAGILNGHGDAFGGVTGTVAFDDGGGLSGSIDYAVFTANAFNTNFGGLGYVPGDALVYTYQINNGGTLVIDGFEIALAGAANTIGSFGPLNAGDESPSTSSFVGTEAQWLFSFDGITGGESSYGLAFSSSYFPTTGSFEVFGGRTSLLASAVPTPFRATAVPEPGSGLLLAAALAGIGRSRRRR